MNQKFCLALAVAVLLACVNNANAAEPAWTTIAVKKMHCGNCAKRIASRLYTVRGVKEVRVDVNKKTLFVVPQQNAVLSPREMWDAVEKADDEPLRLAGPSGAFTEKPQF